MIIRIIIRIIIIEFIKNGGTRLYNYAITIPP